MAAKSPFEIAREALKRLTTRKLVPTPTNYQNIYHEIAGTPVEAPFPEAPLRSIARAIPETSAFLKQQKATFERAIGERSWEGVQKVLLDCASADSRAIDRRGTSATARTVSTAELFELVARLIENALPALDTDDTRFIERADATLKVLRDPSVDSAKARSALVEFCHRLSFAAEDQAEVRAALLKLLHEVIGNIGELSLDNRWLQSQLEVVKQAAEPPLTLRRLDNLNRRLRDMLVKQIDAKSRTLDAQEQTRRMLATFIERLALMTDSTSAYHGKLEESAKLMEQASSFEDVAPVLREVIGTTRVMIDDVAATRDELRSMRDKVDQSDAEIERLQQEIDQMNTQVRHDALTGALNRKGLDDALERELAEVRRKQTSLCVALLDLDNFKQLNDSKGHDAGDDALKHLVAVTRESMRGQDTLARYGGEEFVILMPETPLDDAIEVMTRLQRALTRRYFLAGNEQILITFSAGVAQLAPDEAAQDAISRADQAMYLAKRQGKNRVIGA